jgi:sulfate/thiosulfate transport system ATP-binding protein
MSIQIQNVSKKFGAFTALDNVSLDIASGELVALLSPSGSGKTTLLRIIAGLEWPDQGQVRFHGEDATNTHARERNIGFVFQHYALFRHMTIFENVAFGLRVKPRKERVPEAEVQKRVLDLLKLVQLDWLADRYPHQLSGGQRQRIALARSLAVEPKVLLLDEPFGALDAKVRKELRRWLRRLHDEVRATTVFVTHDQEEAMEVADRIVVMNQGRIEQVGTPDEVYQNPATRFVYEFLGDVNLFHGREYARPHDIEIYREASAGRLAAQVEHIAPRGAVVRIDLSSAGASGTVEAELSRERSRELGLAAGQVVYIRPRALRVFEETREETREKASQAA